MSAPTHFEDESRDTLRASPRSLFIAAFQIGLLSFGGGMSAWLHRDYVVRKNWMSEQDFHTDFAVARMLPGTNISNFLVISGYRLSGFAGAIAGLLGILTAPFFIVLGLAFTYEHFSGPLLGDVLAGAAAAAVGFLVPMIIKSVKHIGDHWTTILVLCAVAAAVTIFGASLPLIVVITLPVSVALLYLRGRSNAR